MAMNATTKARLLTLAAKHGVHVVQAGGDGRDNPDIELLAPDGHRFDYNNTHSLLCFGFKDALTRLRQELPGLAACGADCDCEGGSTWDMSRERVIR